MSFKFKTRKRRGLSSVVGALFFIVLMIAAFTALLAAFSYQNDLIDTQKSIADLQIAKAQENFVVSTDSQNCTVPPVPLNNECLDVTVNNKGTNTVEVAKLWVIEKVNGDGDGNSYEADAYDTQSTLALDYTDLIVPVGTSKLITTDLIPVNTADADGYRIKVVSKLGTIVTVDFPEVGNGPPGPQGYSCWDTHNLGTNDPDEDINGDLQFNGLDCQGPEGPPGIPETPTIEDELFNKPGIFMMFPSPFGQTDKPGSWGAIIANPTENTMQVDKIVFTVIPFSTQSGQTVFDSCTTQTNWTCLGNQVVWKGSSPVDIPAKSATEFFLAVNPSSGNAADVHGLPVFASVLTSNGQFGKTSYLSSVVAHKTNSDTSPIVNVYYSTSKDSLTPTGVISMTAGQQLPIYITMAEKATGSGKYAEAYISSASSNTHLIVNVPKKIVVGDVTNGMGAPNGYSAYTISSVVKNADTSTQIIATLNENIGDNNPAGTDDARSFQIWIEAPDLTALGLNDKLFVMYILADGFANCQCTSSPWPIGPLAEVIIKVHDPDPIPP